jgi:predicted nuclease of restriction endonuclease-like (RecB) superfamily
MRAFYLTWPLPGTAFEKPPTLPAAARAGRIVQTVSAQLVAVLAKECAEHFPLPWSHYARLLAVRSTHARAFYEREALRGGWTIRQLDRQIQSQFYERTALSRDKVALLTKGDQSNAGNSLTPDEEIKDPYLLEFLGLRDEYSESELEGALLSKLQTFLLELGGDFTFVGRQRRLRIGNEWYRVDLLFFHRRLRCLVIIDLKLGKLTHADAGRMHLYLNYAREHWVLPDENPPVGLILCAEKDHAMARYALEGLSNTVLAAEYRTTLPHEQLLAEEIARTRRQLDVQRQDAVKTVATRRLGK